MDNTGALLQVLERIEVVLLRVEDRLVETLALFVEEDEQHEALDLEGKPLAPEREPGQSLG